MWKEFSLENVSFWRPQESQSEATLTALNQLASLVPPSCDSSDAIDDKGDSKPSSAKAPPVRSHPRTEAISAKLQQLWAMSAHCQTARPVVRIGDYEKDGCYEGSLLAYS